MKSLSCPDRRCSRSRKSAARSIIRHGFYKTRWGKRRRYQCRTCGKTFCSTTKTPYYRLQHRRATFDEVATWSVEGMSRHCSSQGVYGELLAAHNSWGLAVLARMVRCAISSSFSFISSLRSLDSWVRAECVLWLPSPFSSNNNS